MFEYENCKEFFFIALKIKINVKYIFFSQIDLFGGGGGGLNSH